jgi:hypothetical protein
VQRSVAQTLLLACPLRLCGLPTATEQAHDTPAMLPIDAVHCGSLAHVNWNVL